MAQGGGSRDWRLGSRPWRYFLSLRPRPGASDTPQTTAPHFVPGLGRGRRSEGFTAVPPERRERRIARLTRQNRQQDRARNIPRRRYLRARIMQWTVWHQRVEAAAHLQIFHEKRQMPQRRHRHARVSFDMNRAAQGVHLHRLAGDIPYGAKTLTGRMTLSGRTGGSCR